jgi:FKBP-type peptidyl-prolyl cis-trans isomerase SlyD
MIQNGTVVGIAYVLTNTKGDELDRAEKDEPFQYLHGAQEMIPGLEKALAGLSVGAKKQVTVSPEDGYGTPDPKLVRKIPKNVFPKDFPVKAGIQFEADLAGDGNGMVYTIKDVGDTVTVDGNHPLAGQTLHFQVEVVSVRKATEEEISHGHAHGPDDEHSH